MSITEYYLNWEYVPENSYDEDDNGITYTWNDVLDIARGNEELAIRIIDNCEWQYPETELDQLIIEEEVAEYKGEYVMLYDDDTLKKLWEELCDIPFDEDDNTNEMILAEDWLVFEAGTSREDIWYWFDEHYSDGVHKLMFPND